MGAHPAPVLTTERLILRGFVAEDFAAKHDILTQSGTQQFLGRPLSWSDHWRRVVSGVGQWTVRGYGGLMVVRKQDDRLIGDIGLFDAQRQIGFDGEPEMGWVFDRAMHGNGYALEACRALLQWADSHVQRDIWAIISPGNDPSYRLADKLGFAVIERSALEGDPIDILKRPYRG
ncbi:GNAT family N-acetyltransferase [Sphingomicrobium flavum]|uniref:GNAT family N-acetyltransferase n=1 Tax=Sphingomicrobium flavum TaxID=1229164 RepID=UPI0021ADAF0F|nr:GNAT family N-acetyltransferase [Sphingomicrobium flavum]